MHVAVFDTSRARKANYLIGGFEKRSFDMHLKWFRQCEFARGIIVKRWRNEGREKIGGSSEEIERFNTVNLQLEYLRDQFMAFKNHLKMCPSEFFYKDRNHNDVGFCLVCEEDYKDYALPLN